MKVLFEIAEATSPISMRKLLTGSHRTTYRRSKIYRFYQYLREGELDEETIIHRLYGKGAEASDGRFRTLKSRLKKIMLESLLNEEVLGGSYKTYDEAYITGYRQLNLVRLLASRRAYNAAAEVASTAFKYVKGYEIIPLNEGLTDILSSLYLGIMNNPRLFKKYHRLHLYYTDALYEFNKISNKYRYLRSRIYTLEGFPKKQGQLQLEFVRENWEILEQYPNVPPLQAMIRVTEMVGYKLTGQYQRAIETGRAAEEALANCKGVSNLVESGLAVFQVECAVSIRDFQYGVLQIEKARKVMPKDTLNSLKVSEYAILLGLQTGNYNYAYQEIRQLNPVAISKLPNKKASEIWVVLHAYIRFLVAAGEITVLSDNDELQNFRLGKFVNDVPSYLADKHGMNIQILVLQVMFFIVRGEHEKVTERVEALARYCNRYLKDNDKLRHNCFFRLLIEVVKGGFDLSSRRRQIKKIYARLISEEALKISKETSSEIMPYEALWKIIEGNLGSRVIFDKN